MRAKMEGMTSLDTSSATPSKPVGTSKAQLQARKAQVRPATEGWEQAKEPDGRPLLQFKSPGCRSLRCIWRT